MVREPLPGVVYPPAAAAARYRAAGALGETTLGQALHAAAQRHADRTALVGGGRRWTYRELDAITDRVAAALLRLGLKPLDRAIMQIGNVPEFFFAAYGCFKAGVVPVCTLAAHREAEIGYLAPFTEARVHFVQGNLAKFDLCAFAAQLRPKSGVAHVVATGGTRQPGVHALEALIDGIDAGEARRAVEALAIDPWNVAVFQLSGGTTGVPKVIPRFHNDYLYNSLAVAAWVGVTQDTVVYWPLPAVHNAGMVGFNLPTHLMGGTVCVTEDVDPDTFLSTIERERVTYTGGVLPVIVRAIERQRANPYDLSSVQRFIATDSGPMIERDLGVPAYHIFGMAEGLVMFTRPHDPPEVRAEMIGRPISELDEIRLARPGTDDPAAEGEDGEFCCRGPYTLHGYYKAPEHNKKAFTQDGMYRSGDLMRATRIGGRLYYKFVGRIKDNIDRGAEKISAEEVETHVGRHPAVASVAAIGMPDPAYGERVCVYLILNPGQAAPTVAELGAFLGTQGLAKFKWPERIEVMENFPVTKVGKVSKALLRDDVTAKLEREKRGKTG
ncbi:MAG: AMP-binding protein [Alphaproteobacteria bacterium]